MIKAVIFDYGGVITGGGTGWSTISDRLAANLHISKAKAHDLMNDSVGDLMRGTIAESQMWHDIETRYGQPISRTQQDIWNTWSDMEPQPEMLELVKHLKQQDLIVGLLSNAVHPIAVDISENGGYDEFEFIILSCRVHYAKPDPEIYQLALERLDDIQPHEIIYVDDQPRMLEPATALGIHTVHANNAAQITKAITTLITTHQ